MSNVNIKRAVENIRSSTTIYTPIVETIVNGIDAIEAIKRLDGSVTVTIHRSVQDDADDLPKITDITIIDNGIGFNQENRDSFDTLYSDHKLTKGGKGFGRFTCLKYFENVFVDSIFIDDKFRRRTFSMGKKNDIIVNENISESNQTETGTKIFLSSEQTGNLHRKLSTIARSLVEMLLPYFITDDYCCPKIILAEQDGSSSIVLNEYLNSSAAVIKEIKLPNNSFTLQSTYSPRVFQVRSFKIFSPRNKASKISLVANKREVTESSIHTYIPEFSDEFYERDEAVENRGKNYIIKSYVFGDYLDEMVSLERGEFEFKKESDILNGISQTDIEREAAEITRLAVQHEVATRFERKKQRIESYVEEEAPWHKSVLTTLNIANLPLNPSNAEIEAALQWEKFRIEIQIRCEVSEILSAENSEGLATSVANIASRISESSKNDLVHYIAMRRKVLDIFQKSLDFNDGGAYSSESAVHDIIFPTKTDSLKTKYEDHNLWIIDERLNFTHYISSDLPLNGGKSERPDILIYDRRVAFRAENEPSNPVTIFEFKRPGRSDFVNPSSTEDPVQQIIRYANSIRAGKFKTPAGREIHISENTPFYGYVICDIDKKVKTWLRTEKDFKPMPDGLGWFKWHDSINLYLEVLSWEKVLRDADMRNKVFFHKLGI